MTNSVPDETAVLEEHEVEKEQVGEKRKQAGEQGAGLGEGTLTGETDSVFCKDCVCRRTPGPWTGSCDCLDWSQKVHINFRGKYCKVGY